MFGRSSCSVHSSILLSITSVLRSPDPVPESTRSCQDTLPSAHPDHSTR